ncbi:MAG: hypothetical protein L0922_05820, partial [Candidatus Mariimomonas ferrooxydans]
MAKKKQPAAVPVEDGLFFPEDFIKLPRRHVIYIKKALHTTSTITHKAPETPHYLNHHSQGPGNSTLP